MLIHAVRITRKRSKSAPEGPSINRSDVPKTFPLLKIEGDVAISIRDDFKKVHRVVGHYNRGGQTIYIPLANWPDSLQLPSTGVADGEVWHDVINIVEI